MSKKYSIQVVILLVLLISCWPSTLFSFTPPDSISTFVAARDTLLIDESAMDNIVYYSAKDSIYTDLRKRQVHLFNEAKVDDGSVQIKAGYILIDLDKNEVYASYLPYKDSVKVQRPVFTDGSEEITASTIRYNFDTKKGYIEEMAVQQDENFLYMEQAKIHENEHIHFLKGRFTTCDLEEPHFHFQLSRAILIPEKRIVSGPMNVWVRGVPTPLGLPFIVIPQVDEDKTKGLIFPTIAPVSNFGFGIQDLGYYLPINDRLQTTFFGTIYSRGSWGIRNTTDYAKRYKFAGKIDLGFQQFMSGFPSKSRQNKLSVTWNHFTDSKSSPYWRFTSNVNFQSDNNTKTNLDIQNSNYFSNTIVSDINLNRNFPGKPLNSGLKLSLKQNSISRNIALTAPVLNFNVTRVFPFKRLILKQNALSRLGITYSFEGKNISNFGDSLLTQGEWNRIGDRFQNGLSHSTTIQTTLNLKDRIKITPSVSYTNRMNFQQIRMEVDTATNKLGVIDTLQLFGMSHKLTFSAQATSAVYSYYRFIGKRNSLLRHVLTPSMSFQYIPKLNSVRYDSTGTYNYSPFQNSVYSSGIERDQALLNFGINNTFELKQRSDKDTITGFRKIRLVDALSITSSYDFLKDSMNLSDFNANMRVSPATWLNFVLNATFHPYGWNPQTGADTSDYAWRHNRKLGRFSSYSFNTTFILASKESREKLQKQQYYIERNWNSDYEYFMLHPEHAVNFSIPWKVTIRHTYQLSLNKDTATFQSRKWNQLQTINFDGDLSITKRWKITGTVNLDVKESKVTNARFGLMRDMHCWALSFSWVPIGGNKSFLFTLHATSSLLKDAKLELKKPPSFL